MKSQVTAAERSHPSVGQLCSAGPSRVVRYMTAARLNVLNNMLGKLGMNPIDRIRLSVTEQPEPDPADEYF